MDTDVVVVGSGGGALVSALHAATRGARVVVLEKAPVFGGTTSLSGGTHWLPGNPLGPKAYGLKDTPEEAERYLLSLGGGRAQKTARAFIQEAPRYYDFLAANTSCEIEAGDMVDAYPAAPGAKDRGRSITIGRFDTNRLGEFKDLLRIPPVGNTTLLPSEQIEYFAGRIDESGLAALAEERRKKGIAVRGRALVGALMEGCLKHKVQLIHNTRAMQLTQENGRVTGVVAQHEGKSETFTARKGVVLASGGFEWNRVMWDSLVGVPYDGAKSPPFNEGDGLRMALAAGARLGNLDQVWWSCSIQIPGETYDGRQRTRHTNIQRPGSITVNRRGRRFTKKGVSGYDGGKPLVYYDPQRHEFPNYPAFIVMDRETYERQPADVDEKAFPPSTWRHEAPTLRELAGDIGVDANGLADTIKKWNESCERGVDPESDDGEFEYTDTSGSLKKPSLRPIGAGPYYAFKLGATCYGTKGGAVIDEQARVLGFDDKPIPGLFAAGNMTACAYGMASPGRGSSLPPALVFGWVAGRTASA